ncbi:hypothetical protein [Agarivorans sp. Z349TD_8]|uniref:hypothetical protein n=1 Tax=Agarivorans sp. Z349TD_8 TaxID=3421434 RepID=UPI003D7EFAC2
MSRLSAIDWPKLKAQFGDEALVRHWLQDFLQSSKQDLLLIAQAQQQQCCSKGLLQQLQGLASLLCSTPLNRCVQQLKHSETLEQDLSACVDCYQQVCHEVRRYLAS